MVALTLFEAADLVDRFYSAPDGDDVTASIDEEGAQAYMLSNGILVIPGTNELSDWFRFNFDVYDRDQDSNFVIKEHRGASGRRYHAGFLNHARKIFDFAKPLKPKLIIGHSLGAASAQIVGWSLKCPTIAFASPRVIRGRSELKYENIVLNICRTDDLVTQVPPAILGFQHIGQVFWMSPRGREFGEDHRIDQYVDMMKARHVRNHLPEKWPFFA
ncbi:MAG: hypothetical protein AAFX00_10450 [Pseudomonadota bacterium]